MEGVYRLHANSTPFYTRNWSVCSFWCPGGSSSHEYHGRTIIGAFCSVAERLGCLYLLGLDFPKVAHLAWVCLPFQVYQFRMPPPPAL